MIHEHVFTWKLKGRYKQVAKMIIKLEVKMLADKPKEQINRSKKRKQNQTVVWDTHYNIVDILGVSEW